MNHLPYPFGKSGSITIKTSTKKIVVPVELADSEIEIFQSLNYRTSKDFKTPLLLKFENPLVQSLSLQKFKFDAEQILVEDESNIVRGIQLIKKVNGSGKYIQAYAGFSIAILAPIGFAKKFGIDLNKTIIKLNK